MAGRTEQDNDITLYSLEELRHMLETRNAIGGRWVPFSKKALEDEIERRLTDEG